MSDLISSPSQSQSAVSNDAFESLVELLASDGIDENSPKLPGSHPRSQANVTLRDASGKLDFDKIRLMFASQNGLKPLGEETKRVQSLQTPALPNDEGDSDDESHSHRSTPPTAPSRSNSMSPRPVEHATTGHRRSSTFGDQPWAAIHGNMTEAKVEDVPPTLLHQPLSFDELNTALAGAHEEVRSLRQQYDELQALVSKRFGPEIRDRAKRSPSAVNTGKVTPDGPDNSNGRVEARDTGSQIRPSTVVPPAPPSSDVPTEIANLSENEAKRALGALVCSLNLSPSVIGPMANPLTPAVTTSPHHSLSPPNGTRRHDVASIARALKFLGTVDELVWRRTSSPTGPRTLPPVFSEENAVALAARLELWERAVRRSSRC